MDLFVQISKVDDDPDWLRAGVISRRSRKDRVEFLTELNAFFHLNDWSLNYVNFSVFLWQFCLPQIHNVVASVQQTPKYAMKH